ncbi:hypothetical protein Dip510_000766 [Elusimicrobium posterum]|uniref:hypothetical protein n=1 Tax=Elusimicrobium posterum TaxID=3116653 RepID=UPI003C74427F
MKKLAILAVLCLCVTGAQAYTYHEDNEMYGHITDAFFMPRQGQIVIDTTGSFGKYEPNSGDNYEFYQLDGRLGIGFTDWLELGAGIGYRIDKDENAAGDKEKDFTNPYAYGRIRAIDRMFVLDVIAKATFDAMDTVAEGGIESGTQKYEAGVLGGLRFNRVSVGAKIMGGYWYKGDEIYNPDEDYMVNVTGDVFVNFRPLNFLNLGAHAGLTSYAVDASDYNFYEYFAGVSADLSIIEGHLAVGAYYDFVTMDDDDSVLVKYDQHNFGIRLKAAF